MSTLAPSQETAALITASTRPEAIVEALRRVLPHKDLQEVATRLMAETQAQSAAASH
ncbi:MAG: hypothetical protein O2890_11465 [Cyanobacteria bacterium]|nr:hypothetical protein [Cyanobacteriota bacterium]MDA0867013.1 hypothetical protein [Cyanobacteriota bacterium]